jgi:hypothetical protein
MSSIPFDTHAYVKKLLAAGFSESQAEVQAQAIAELVNEQLATKRDLKELEAALRRDIEALRTELKRDIEALRTELKRDLKELELRITVRLGALITAGVGLIVILQQVLK